MALADDYAAAQDPGLQARIQAAIYNFVETVDGELSTVTGHALRVTFANKVVSGQVNMQPLIIHACCFAHLTNLSSAPSTDTIINNAVAACWNIWAGV